MCAHIGQNRHIYPPSIFRLHFDSYPLPLLRRLTVGAAIEKNFFIFFSESIINSFWLYFDSDFIFFVSPIRFLLVFYFFYFFKTLLQLVKFSLGIPYQLLSFLVLYSFDYDLDLLHIVENYGFDIISRFRISDSKFLLVF